MHGIDHVCKNMCVSSFIELRKCKLIQVLCLLLLLLTGRYLGVDNHVEIYIMEFANNHIIVYHSLNGF